MPQLERPLFPHPLRTTVHTAWMSSDNPVSRVRIFLGSYPGIACKVLRALRRVRRVGGHSFSVGDCVIQSVYTLYRVLIRLFTSDDLSKCWRSVIAFDHAIDECNRQLKAAAH